MSGEADWVQKLIGEPGNPNHMAVWVHKPCGALIAIEGTSVHSGVCPANTLKA